MLIKRNLDGCYFRFERDGKYENICFSDLTETERNKVLETFTMEGLKLLCCILADQLRKIGDEFDIVGRDGIEVT